MRKSLAILLAVAGLSGTAHAETPEDFGIEIVGMRLAAAGTMLDLRVRVIEPEKAARFTDQAISPELVDAETGVVLIVPAPEKVGSLRQHTRHLRKGQVLISLFTNPGRVVKAGGKVSLRMGELRLDNIPVEG